MSDDRIFGPDRDEPPGITPIPHAVTPSQIIEWNTETCLIHSTSQGWLAAVAIRIATEDGAGIAGVIAVGPELAQIINNLRLASRRARRDLSVARQRGDLT